MKSFEVKITPKSDLAKRILSSNRKVLEFISYSLDAYSFEYGDIDIEVRIKPKENQ